MDNNTLLGRFFFKKTDNGNLIGEFSNYQDPRIYAESADLIEGCDDCSFLGKYHSSWLDDSKPQFAELKIYRKVGACKIFTLEWREKMNPNPIYVGEGMLCDGILVGDYHQP